MVFLLVSQKGWTQHISITSTTPSANSINAALDSDIILNFSSNIDGSTIHDTTLVVHGAYSGIISATVSGQGTSTLTIDPTQDFYFGEMIYVTATTNIKSTGGDSLSSAYTFSFKSQSNLSPSSFVKDIIFNDSDTEPIHMYAADIDGDGDLDFAAGLTASAADNLAWFENDGNASFTRHNIAGDINSSTNTLYLAPVAADFDKDGDVDLAASVYTLNKIYVYENDGSENFTSIPLDYTFTTPSLATVSDLNGNGYTDIIVADTYDADIVWLKNKGTSTIDFGSKIIISGLPRRIQRFEVADLDNDGDLDIVLTIGDSGNPLLWFENDGTQNFTQHSITIGESYLSGLKTADMDSDGDLDLLIGHDNGYTLLENDGGADPQFSEQSISSSVSDGGFIFTNDFDGDGHTDFAAYSGDNAATLFYRNSGNTNPAFTEYKVNTDLTGEMFISGDYNGDGFLDLMMSNRADKIVLFENTFVPTIAGRSVYVDGSGQFLNLNEINSSFTGTEDMSVEFWVKANKNDQPGGDASTLFALQTASSSDKLLLQMGEGSTQDGRVHLSASGFTIDGTTDVGDENWHHIAIVQHTIDDSIYVYIDGKKEGTYSTSGISLSSDDQWSIGQSYEAGNPNNFLKGHIDEVRIWNVALSDEQIQHRMFQSLGGDESGLTGYWPLDESRGYATEDQSANDQIAVLEGAATRSSDTHSYGTFITGNEGWRIMSSPSNDNTISGTEEEDQSSSYFGASYGEILEPLWTQGFQGADVTDGVPNVYTWSEGDGSQDTTGRGWQPLTDANDYPTPGTAFLVYVYDDQDHDGISDGFPKSISVDSAQNSGTIYFYLSLTKQNGSYEEARDGWNLIGNPFGSTIDWDASTGWSKSNIDQSFYVWSDSANGGAGAYLSWNGSTGTLPNGLIAPMQGFWVKANNNGKPWLYVEDEARSSGGILRKEKGVPEIKFRLKDGKKSSTAIVMLKDKASAGKDPFDTWKLESLNPQEYLSLYTNDADGNALDINALPLKLETPLDIDLDFKDSDAGGQYTLKWNIQALPKGIKVVLHDTYTDQKIDVNKTDKYRFNAPKQKQPSARSVTNSPLKRPMHSPIPTVLKAKSKNPRFALSLVPAKTNNTVSNIPQKAELNQNYPNPFNPETVIRYAVPEQTQVQLNVYDVLGRRVRTLLNTQKSPGRYTVNFDGKSLASGLYIYQLKVGNKTLTKKMMLVK
ncbi:FG-GAP-like repeat-containing protein [Fodinibius halophilus]|uniref:FG-GAP-like repeat-containing protein n=1 Tax=Fodinibius halophilus TaxID=1736908 RepID=UPI00197ABF71|nr:FG-GAP-like repeat-containing protein [Fodinibius halophilus]